MLDARQRKANVRMGLILAATSLALALAFVARMVWLGP